MQKAIDIIQRNAKELKKLEQSEQYLFDSLNSKPKTEIEELVNDFGFVRSDLKLPDMLPTMLTDITLQSKNQKNNNRHKILQRSISNQI